MKLIYLFILAPFLLFSQSGELNLLSQIYTDSSASKISAAKGLSVSVVPVSAALPAGILITGLVKKDSALIEKGIKASVAYALNAAVSLGLKYAVDRRRPFAAYPNLFTARDHVGPYSFPSGHTSFAFAAATSATMSFPKWYVAVPAYAWAAGAGWSRMQLGVHYPTDVLMGAVVGTASSFLMFKLEKWVNRKKKIR